MIQKAKSQFSYFYDIFKHHDPKERTAEETILYEGTKKERYDFLELNSLEPDEHTYNKTIESIMENMEQCSICLNSRFENAKDTGLLQFLTTDCGHSFCVPCFRMFKEVFVNFLFIFFCFYLKILFY
jgi:hypothetical protein